MRCHILCSVLCTGILIPDILMETASMILLNKPCSLQNRISKSEIIQTVPITKPHVDCKTIMILPHTPLRRVSSYPRFTGLTYTPQCYTTWLHTSLPLMTEVAHAMIFSFFNNIKRRVIPYMYILEK